MRQRISTDSVHESERLAFWHEVVCSVFVPLRVSMARTSGYRAEVTQDVCGALEVNTVSAESQVVHRTPRGGDGDPSARVFLGLQLAGRGVVRQDDRECRLDPGEAVLFDPARPYSMAFADRFSLSVFCLPAPLFDQIGSGTASLTARTLRPLGNVAAAALSYLTCVATVSLGPGLVDPALANGALAVAATLLRDVAGTADDQHPQDPVLAQAVTFIDLHLADPGLSPDDVAAACHVSRRQLYRVFDGAGEAVATVIRKRRLVRATALLQSLAQDTPVAWVGAKVGFASPEQFTRAFRAVYGLPPAAWRASTAALRSAGTQSLP